MLGTGRLPRRSRLVRRAIASADYQRQAIEFREDKSMTQRNPPAPPQPDPNPPIPDEPKDGEQEQDEEQDEEDKTKP